MHAVTYTDSQGLTNVFEFPTSTTIEDEPIMDGFEHVAQAASHEADFVLIEDWLGAELVEYAA